MAITLGICIGFSLLCLEFFGGVNGDSKLEGYPDLSIQTECRDRYLWVHVASTGGALQFEAVDGIGVHSIDEQHATRCGYTISTFRMDGYTTFRASYFSCHTDNQNDKVFTFNLNVIVIYAEGQWSSHPLSKTCSLPLPWSQREVTCEENYMEVNVRRDVPCEANQGTSKEAWQAAFPEAQKTANSAWQVRFIKNEEQTASMSISDIHQLGYSLSGTSKGVVFRSPYRQPQSEVVMVENVSVELLRGTLYYRQKLMVVMIDISIACTVNSGSFDGARLFWDIPRVMSPLLRDSVGFESTSIRVGVESQLLDEVTAQARGFILEFKGPMVQMSVPFGAVGGYRRSLVVNNVYRETYVIFFFYEHIFSMVHGDGSAVETRHRLLRVVDAPLRCQRPFTIDQTIVDEHVFTVHLVNIPYDVTLVEVTINDKQLSMKEAAEHGYTISKIVNANGTHTYILQVPFEDRAVHRTYLGEGFLQYSLDLNYTLYIMPQQDPYYHHTFAMVQLHNAFPPELNAECTEGSITFRMVKQPRLGSLWEIGVGHEPLTPELAVQRGYILQNDSQSITLEVPLFSIGYIYEDINLQNFYGTFNVLSRDSKTLEVQSSTSKRCLFKTEKLIVCSTDGTMTVVTTPTLTWPTVDPRKTTLLDRGCRPKETDQSRALFQFSLNTCGTRVMVGDSFVVYENEILHDMELIPDGGSFISRDSKFKFTVRCFYPLSAVTRLFVDKIFRLEMPGSGSIKVIKRTKDAASGLPALDCSLQAPVNTESDPVFVNQKPSASGANPYPSRPRPNIGPSHFVTVPAGSHKWFPGTHATIYGSRNSQHSPTYNPPAPEGQDIGPQPILLQFIPPSSQYDASQTGAEQVFGSQTNGFSNNPPRFSYSQDYTAQQSHVNTPNVGSLQMGSLQGTGQKDSDEKLAFNSNDFNRVPHYPLDNYHGSLETVGQGGIRPSIYSNSPIDNIFSQEDGMQHSPSHLNFAKTEDVPSTVYGGSKRQSPSENKPIPGHQISLQGSSIFQQMGTNAETDLYSNSQYGLYQSNNGKYETSEYAMLGSDTRRNRPSHERDAKPALSHYGSLVGKIEIVHSGSKFSPGSFNTEQSAVYQFPSNDLTGSHHYNHVQMENVPTSQFNPDYEKPFHYGTYQTGNDKVHNSATSNVQVVPSRDKKYVPAAGNARSKSRRDKLAHNLYGNTQGSSTNQKILQSATLSQNIQHTPPQHINIKPTPNEQSPQSSQVEHNSMRTGLFEQNGVHPFKPTDQHGGPQSIQVKPPSQFALYGKDLHQQSFSQHKSSPSHSIKQAPNLYDDSQDIGIKTVTAQHQASKNRLTGMTNKYNIPQHVAQSANGDTNLIPITLQQEPYKYEGAPTAYYSEHKVKPTTGKRSASDCGNEKLCLATFQSVPSKVDGSDIRVEYEISKAPSQQLVQPDIKQGREPQSARVKSPAYKSDISITNLGQQALSRYRYWSGFSQEMQIQTATEGTQREGDKSTRVKSASAPKNVPRQALVSQYIRIKPAPTLQQVSHDSRADQTKGHKSTQKATVHYDSETSERNGKPPRGISKPLPSQYGEPQGGKVDALPQNIKGPLSRIQHAYTSSSSPSKGKINQLTYDQSFQQEASRTGYVVPSSGTFQPRPGQAHQNDRNEPSLSQLGSSKLYSGSSRIDPAIGQYISSQKNNPPQPAPSKNEGSLRLTLKAENPGMPSPQSNNIQVTSYYGDTQRGKAGPAATLSEYGGSQTHVAEPRPSPSSAPIHGRVRPDASQRRGTVYVRVKPVHSESVFSQQDVYQQSTSLYGGPHVREELSSNDYQRRGGRPHLSTYKPIPGQFISGIKSEQSPVGNNLFQHVPLSSTTPSQTLQVKPSSSKSAPSQSKIDHQHFNQYRDLVSNKVDTAPWQNIIQPVTGGQDAGEHAAPNRNDHFQLNGIEAGTSHYESSTNQRESASNQHTPVRIKIRPASSILAIQSEYNKKQQNVQPSTDVSTVGQRDPTQACKTISQHTVSKTSVVQPNPSSVQSIYGTNSANYGSTPYGSAKLLGEQTGLVSGNGQQPPKIYQKVFQAGQPDHNRMTYGSTSAATKFDQTPYKVKSSGQIEIVESDPNENCSNNGNPTNVIKVSSWGSTQHMSSQSSDTQNNPNGQTDHGQYLYDDDMNPVVEEHDPNLHSSHTGTDIPDQNVIFQIQVHGDCSKSGRSLAPSNQVKSDATGRFGASVHDGILRGQRGH